MGEPTGRIIAWVIMLSLVWVTLRGTGGVYLSLLGA